MKTFWEKWKKNAIHIANFQIKLLLGIIYFVIILPYYIYALLSKFFVPRKAAPPSLWQDIKITELTKNDLRKQY